MIRQEGVTLKCSTLQVKAWVTEGLRAGIRDHRGNAHP